jgi:Fic family protein
LRPPPSDLDYLAELIEDFPPKQPVKAEDAWKELESRYLQLEKICPVITGIIKKDFMNDPVRFKSFFSSLIRALHLLLFRDILSNAGQYRKSSEPNNGYVGFGGMDTRSPQGARFHGSPASEIVKEIEKTGKVLSPDDANPIKSSIFFYQRLVSIHPFYDANGRVGRLIVTIYLALYGYQVLWKDLETTKRNKFLDRLNQCHKREGKPVKQDYLGYLYEFWKAFVIPEKELEMPGLS